MSTQRVIPDYEQLATPFKPTGLLPVPHHSQVGVGANYASSDCGPACTAMIIKAFRPEFSLSVNDLFKRVREDKKDFTNYSNLTTLLREENVDAVRMNGLTAPQVFDLLRAGRPILALISYKILNEAGLTEKKDFFGNHFVVVIGMDSETVYTHDPYCNGDNGEALPYPSDLFFEAWNTAIPRNSGLVPVRSLYAEENDRFPVLYRIKLNGNNMLYNQPNDSKENQAEFYSGGEGDQLNVYGEDGHFGLVRPWPGHWIDLDGRYVEKLKIPVGAPQRVLTNLDTNEQLTFSDSPAGLRPLRLLEVPFVPIETAEGQSIKLASAAACGAALLTASQREVPVTFASLLKGIETTSTGENAHQRLISALAAHDFALRWDTGLSLFDFMKNLKANKPLVLPLNFSLLDPSLDTPGEPAEQERFVILIGMDNYQACFHDPAFADGAARCLPLNSFASALAGEPGAYTALTLSRRLDAQPVPAGPKKGDSKPAPAPTTQVPTTQVPATQVPATQVPATQVPATPTLTNPAPATQTKSVFRVEIKQGCSVHIRSKSTIDSDSKGTLGEGEKIDILEVNNQTNYGRFAPNRWITLSPTYVKKI